MSTVAGIVLAAGEGRRFGATKQLARLGGCPLVVHAVDAALAAGLDEVVVVVGHDGHRVAEAVTDDPRVRTVANPRHADGQSTSLAAGLDALGDEVGAAVVLLGDQPGVAATTITAVVDAWRAAGGAVRARYDDGPGHPVAFDRALWPRLRTITGDRGARDLLADLDVAEATVNGARPPDVDHPADLDGLVRRLDGPAG